MNLSQERELPVLFYVLPKVLRSYSGAGVSYIQGILKVQPIDFDHFLHCAFNDISPFENTSDNMDPG